MVARPPYWAAGKNFVTCRPCSMAEVMSEGVTQPGRTGRPSSMQCFTTSSLYPGETMNFAPAARAWSTCST